MELASLLALVTLTFFAIAVTAISQRVIFSPLAKYPGPLFWKVSRFPYMLAFRSGTLSHQLKRFHEQYGEIVQVAPNELSFSNPNALRDIYTKKDLGGTSREALPKDPVRFPPAAKGQPISILDALDADHARIRKAWAPSFSSSALSLQEPVVASYVTKLIDKLHQIHNADSVDLQVWFSYCTFDIIGALSFGEDFGCLENARYHTWVAGLVYSIKAKVQIAACRFYPVLYTVLLRWTTSSKAKAAMVKHAGMAREKVMSRLSNKAAAPGGHADFLSYVQKGDLTEAEIITNSATMIFAGSHTLQTTLTGFVFFLLENPQALNRLSKEIRATFQTEDQISWRRLAEIEYLDACLQEALRLTSPVPLSMTRMIPPGGAVVGGEFLQSGTIVGYMTLAGNYSPRNFTRPTEFLPERWMKASKNMYSQDRRNAHVPFLLGPRDCIGQNLARMEILLIIGHLIYNFDISHCGPGVERLQNWEDQETYAVWVRTPLLVRLRPVRT